MRRCLVLIAAAACFSAPALATDQRQAADGSTGATSDSASDDERVVCRRRQTDFDTGSHLSRSRRVCRTRAQWREIQDMTERQIRKINDGVRDVDAAVGVGNAAPN